MPVITRNQSKKIALQEKLEDSIIKQDATNVKQDINNALFNWFFTTIKNTLNQMQENYNEKITIKKFLNEHGDKAYISIELKTHLKEKLRTNHFDNIRCATEMMFFIEQYLPEVQNPSSSVNKFTKSVYNKIFQFYEDIRLSDIQPETEDEHKVINALIGVLQNVEKMIIPILSEINIRIDR